MFEVGWTEMLVIAIVMIVVVGPKDLPGMLRTFGRTVAKLRSMAGDFQKQFNEALKEAELEDVKKSVDALRGLNPTAEIKKQLNPFEKAAADVRAGLDNAMKPKPAPAAVTEAKPAEPLKGDTAAAPAGKPPEATPAFPAMTDASVVASPPAKKSVKRAAAKTAAPAKAVAAKSPPAKATPAQPVATKPVATKPVASKPAVAKPAAARSAAAKPAPAKAVASNAAPVKAAAGKKPAAVKKKTAGAAK